MRSVRRAAFALSVLVGAAPAQAQPCVMMVFNPDHSVVLNGSAVDLAALPARLAVIARRTPRPHLCVVASPQSSYDEVEAALRVVQKSGLTVNMTGMQARP